MPDVLAIGYGNILRGDDAFGHAAVRYLNRHGMHRYMDTLTVHQLTPELAETAAKYERVIFIDASVGESPGTVAVKRLEPDITASGSVTHDVEAEAVLLLAGRLYGNRPDAIMITVQADSFESAAGLSESVRDSLPEVLDIIRGAIGKHDGSHSGNVV